MARNSDSALATLEEALDSAQNEHQAAELASKEATARAEQARDELDRLKAAVAAMKGERTPAPRPPRSEAHKDERRPDMPEADGSNPSRPTNNDDLDLEMSPEEWEADRKRKRKAREKEAAAQNPYSQIKCSGCGVAGKMNQSIITAPNGAHLRMMVCGGCGNQTMS